MPSTEDFEGASTLTRVLRVLVVEDEPLLAATLVELLEDEGYAVELAPDGAAAENAMRASSFALVLLDCTLPPPNGLELLARWRGAGRAEPVVLMSGDRELAAGAAGAQAFLAKPFAFYELLSLVERLAAPGSE